MKPPILRPAAAADVEGAYRWYEDQRAGLGEEFLAAVEAGLEMIAAVHQQQARDRRARGQRTGFGEPLDQSYTGYVLEDFWRIVTHFLRSTSE